MPSTVLRSLRTMPTRRLIVTALAVVAGAGSVTAIALAATAGGPVPPAKNLSAAIHDALAAPAVDGVSARIEFTDHLVGSDAVQGSDPVLSGASGRLWAAPGGLLRLELQSDNGDAQLVSDGHTLTFYDPSMHVAYRVALPARRRPATDRQAAKVPTIAAIQRLLGRLVRHLVVSPAVPSDVAGQAAYTVRVGPRRDGGLLRGAELAWDAANGVPLRAAVYAVGDDSPVLELKATDISFGSVPDSTFAVTPPPDVKVTEVRQRTHTAARGDGQAAHPAPVVGTAAVRRALPFALSAPETVAGMRRSDVRLLDMGKRPAALVTYGRGLGGIAVLESPAGAAAPARSGSKDEGGSRLQLPTVSVGTATAQVLPTALGTLVTFTRGGVHYVVAGSVGQSVAEAAARGL